MHTQHLINGLFRSLRAKSVAAIDTTHDIHHVAMGDVCAVIDQKRRSEPERYGHLPQLNIDYRSGRVVGFEPAIQRAAEEQVVTLDRYLHPAGTPEEARRWLAANVSPADRRLLDECATLFATRVALGRDQSTYSPRLPEFRHHWRAA